MGLLDGLLIDILQLIAKKIDDHADVLRFSVVCRKFRSIVMDNLHLLPPKLPLCLCVLPSKPPPLPLLMHFHDEEWENIKFFSIFEGKNYGEFVVPEMRNKWVVGSSYGWLLTVDIESFDRDIHLLNPLTRTQIPLPFLSRSQYPECCFFDPENDDYEFVQKAIALSDPSNKRRNLDDADCIFAMAIISNYQVLSFCRIGDNKWTNVDHSPINLTDVICYKGQIYAVDYMGMAFVYDFAGDKKMKQIANAVDVPLDDDRYPLDADRYLVESMYGDLLQVVRVLNYESLYKTIEFLVYKLEDVDDPVEPEDALYVTLNDGVPERGKFKFKWVEMESLGDQALFLGQNHSLCVPAVNYQGCKPNFIYFTKHGLGYRNIARGVLDEEMTDGDALCDMGIYNFGDKNFQRFSQLDVTYYSPPIWILPNPW